MEVFVVARFSFFSITVGVMILDVSRLIRVAGDGALTIRPSSVKVRVLYGSVHRKTQ